MVDKTVKNGDNVKIDYEGTFDSGEVFDTSMHGDHSHPIEFKVGEGEVIAGFDKAVVGMKVGDEKKFRIESKEAYGEHRVELIREIPRENLPQDQEPKVGMMLVMGTPDGRQFPAKIVKVDQKSVSLDLNHPLAGKSLNFKIKVVSIA